MLAASTSCWAGCFSRVRMPGPMRRLVPKQEFLKEIQIDPSNAGAHYILGELARRDEKCDEAIPQFSEATQLDPNFAEAYLGKGLCLVTLKKYEDAIPPLRIAERLTAGKSGGPQHARRPHCRDPDIKRMQKRSSRFTAV